MKGPPLGPGGEDITWPDQVAPRGRKASSTRKIRTQTSNLPGHPPPSTSDSTNLIPPPLVIDSQATLILELDRPLCIH